MKCIPITQEIVTAEVVRLTALPGYSAVSDEKIGEDFFIDYTLCETVQRFKVVNNEDFKNGTEDIFMELQVT